MRHGYTDVSLTRRELMRTGVFALAAGVGGSLCKADPLIQHSHDDQRIFSRFFPFDSVRKLMADPVTYLRSKGYPLNSVSPDKNSTLCLEVAYPNGTPSGRSMPFPPGMQIEGIDRTNLITGRILRLPPPRPIDPLPFKKDEKVVVMIPSGTHIAYIHYHFDESNSSDIAYQTLVNPMRVWRRFRQQLLQMQRDGDLMLIDGDGKPLNGRRVSFERSAYPKTARFEFGPPPTPKAAAGVRSHTRLASLDNREALGAAILTLGTCHQTICYTSLSGGTYGVAGSSIYTTVYV